MFRRALDYNARKVTSRLRVPNGDRIYRRLSLTHPSLDITRTTLPVNHGRLTGRGIRMVQLSDLHLGLYVGNREISWLAEQVEAQEPDVIFITGDFVNRTAEEAYPAFDGLRALASVAPTYGILGNHDFWNKPEELAAFLNDSGIRLLRNEHLEVTFAGNRILLAGVDDWKTGHDDLEKAVAGMPQDVRYRILLSHCPDLLHPAAEHGFDLVLSGHTHGAQVRVPVIGSAVNRWMHGEFERGWMKSGETALYINRGLGAVFLPVRYRSRAEVTVLHLAAATLQQGAEAPRTAAKPALEPVRAVA